MACQLHGLLQSKGYFISWAWTERVRQKGSESKKQGTVVEGIKRFWLTVDATPEIYPTFEKSDSSNHWTDGNATGHWFILLWFCCIQSNSIHWAGTPLCCCISVSLHQGFTTNRWSHVVVCTGRKQFTILEFEPCWGVVLWIDRKSIWKCEGKPEMCEKTCLLVYWFVEAYLNSSSCSWNSSLPSNFSLFPYWAQ